MKESKPNGLLEFALEYKRLGFKVFPTKLDKTPYTPHGLKDATQLDVTIREYWSRWPEAGIGLVTDGYLVLDFDKSHGGLESKLALMAKYGIFPETRVHKTGGGGEHWIYKGIAKNTVRLGGFDGIDVRGTGGYVVGPPSLHPSGNKYEVLIDKPIAEAPEWLIKLCLGRIPQPTTTSSTNGTPIPDGQRNDTLTRLAGAMRRRGANEAAILAALKETPCQTPLEDRELEAIAKSVSRYEPVTEEPVREYALTDSGNAEYFVSLYGDKLRRDHINKLLPLCLDDGDNYKSEWMKLNRRRRMVPPELENDAAQLVKNLRKCVKR